MASHTFSGKEDVIEIVTNEFDKVGYTKADEADMAKQNKKQQFHVSCLVHCIFTTPPFLIQVSADSISSPSSRSQPQH